MIDGVSQWILSLLIIFPILVAFFDIVLMQFPTTANYSIHRKVALTGIVVEFILSLHLIQTLCSVAAINSICTNIELFAALKKKTGIKYMVS